MEQVRAAMMVFAALACSLPVAVRVRCPLELALCLSLAGLTIVDPLCKTCGGDAPLNTSLWIAGSGLVLFQVLWVKLAKPEYKDRLVGYLAVTASLTQAAMLISQGKSCIGCALFLAGQIIVAQSSLQKRAVLHSGKLGWTVLGVWACLLAVSATGFRVLKRTDAFRSDPANLLNRPATEIFSGINSPSTSSPVVYMITMRQCPSCEEARKMLGSIGCKYIEVPYCGAGSKGTCVDPGAFAMPVAPTLVVISRGRIIGINLGVGRVKQIKTFLSTSGVNYETK